MSKARRVDAPYMIVKLLNSLKGFYMFKELEENVGDFFAGFVEVYEFN